MNSKNVYVFLLTRFGDSSTQMPQILATSMDMDLRNIKFLLSVFRQTQAFLEREGYKVLSSLRKLTHHINYLF